MKLYFRTCSCIPQYLQDLIFTLSDISWSLIFTLNILLSTLLFTVEVPFYEYEDEQMAYDFESAETRDFSAYAYPAPGIDRELSAQYHPGVGGMDDDIPVLKEKENDKNVNNNDGKRLPRAGRIRSVFPDSWIWTETNIRYLIEKHVYSASLWFRTLFVHSC